MIAASDLPTTLYPATEAFQVLFNYVEVGTQPDSAWDGFTVRALGRAALSTARTTKCHDLLFVLRNDAGRLSGAVSSRTRRYGRTGVQEMASAYGERCVGRITAALRGPYGTAVEALFILLSRRVGSPTTVRR